MNLNSILRYLPVIPIFIGYDYLAGWAALSPERFSSNNVYGTALYGLCAFLSLVGGLLFTRHLFRAERVSRAEYRLVTIFSTALALLIIKYPAMIYTQVLVSERTLFLLGIVDLWILLVLCGCVLPVFEIWHLRIAKEQPIWKQQFQREEIVKPLIFILCGIVIVLNILTKINWAMATL